MKKLILPYLLIASLFCCDDTTTHDSYSYLELDIDGLENLGDDYLYEGWLVSDSETTSAGVFSVNDSGELSETRFKIDFHTLSRATSYVLTIEPVADLDSGPSNVHILAGDFLASAAEVKADLKIDHSAAFGNNFSTASGKFILATPTDGAATTNESSGIWWLDPSAGPGPGLVLPELNSAWRYEGWAVINNIPVSTGKFTSVDEADASAVFSATDAAAPSFPGEDFLKMAPDGLSFPLADLVGANIVISVEPYPDNSPSPFLLKPLMYNVVATDAVRSPLTMLNTSAFSNPFGTVRFGPERID